MERFGYINFQWLKILEIMGLEKYLYVWRSQNGKNEANNPTETLAKGFNTNSLQKNLTGQLT